MHVLLQVQSYAAMRKFAGCKDNKGVLRSCLNNKPVVMLGLLDQVNPALMMRHTYCPCINIHILLHDQL